MSSTDQSDNKIFKSYINIILERNGINISPEGEACMGILISYFCNKNHLLVESIDKTILDTGLSIKNKEYYPINITRSRLLEAFVTTEYLLNIDSTLQRDSIFDIRNIILERLNSRHMVESQLTADQLKNLVIECHNENKKIANAYMGMKTIQTEISSSNNMLNPATNIVSEIETMRNETEEIKKTLQDELGTKTTTELDNLLSPLPIIINYPLLNEPTIGHIEDNIIKEGQIKSKKLYDQTDNAAFCICDEMKLPSAEIYNARMNISNCRSFPYNSGYEHILERDVMLLLRTFFGITKFAGIITQNDCGAKSVHDSKSVLRNLIDKYDKAQRCCTFNYIIECICNICEINHSPISVSDCKFSNSFEKLLSSSCHNGSDCTNCTNHKNNSELPKCPDKYKVVLAPANDGRKGKCINILPLNHPHFLNKQM
jgi:hypothetical protein